MAPRQRADERDRHLLAHPPGTQPRRATASSPSARGTSGRRVEDKVRDTILDAQLAPQTLYVDLDSAPEIDRQLLVERHLISKQHATAEGARGVAIGENETLSIMVNEEDHLRIQVLRSGLQLEEAWEQINKIDDELEVKLDFAFHPRFGYLTACPTNVGTGIRVSVMLHLPALKLTGEIEKVFRAAKDMRLAVRGLYGEGTEATGDFYQISNQTTLGKSEDDIISDFKHLVIPKIIDYEHHARKTLLNDRTVALDDKVCRALGILRTRTADGQRGNAVPAQPPAHGHQPRPDQGHRHPHDQRAVPAHPAGPPAKSTAESSKATSAAPPAPTSSASALERELASLISTPRLPPVESRTWT